MPRTIYRRPVARLATDNNFHWGYTVTQDGLINGGPYFAGLGAQTAAAKAALASVPRAMMQCAANHFGVYPVHYTNAPDTYDWDGVLQGQTSNSLDYATALIEQYRNQTNGKLMMQQYGIPGWQAGLAIGNDFTASAPDTLAHEDAFAADCALYVARYNGTGGRPNVKYFPVWNEMKGLDASGMNSTERTKYIRIYNKVYDAIKVARPDNSGNPCYVGGPYVKWLSYGTTLPVGGQPSSDNGLAACNFTGGNIHNHVLDLHYEFERDAHGYDFIATDVWAGNDYHDVSEHNIDSTTTQHTQMTSKFSTIIPRLRSMHPRNAGKPIIFVEFYPQGEASGWNGTDTWTNADVEDWVIELLNICNPYGPGWLCAWGENAEPPIPILYASTGAAQRIVTLLINREASL